MKPQLIARMASPPSPPTDPAPTFDEFFATTWPLAYRLAVFFTQDREAGEEIAQDAMTRLYATWATVERPEAYLRTTIVNTATNWHRRNHTRRTKLALVARPEAVDFVAEELADAIARLPFRQRAVVILRYYADLSEAEIAETLGCRPGTVKSLASRALTTLSKELPR